MAKYVYVYHGGTAPSSPEAGQKAMKAWETWFASLGAAVVDGGNPVGASKTVTATGVVDNGGSNPVSGYSLITAASEAEALEMAKGCPMVIDGTGSVEVAECFAM